MDSIAFIYTFIHLFTQQTSIVPTLSQAQCIKPRTKLYLAAMCLVQVFTRHLLQVPMMVGKVCSPKPCQHPALTKSQLYAKHSSRLFTCFNEVNLLIWQKKLKQISLLNNLPKIVASGHQSQDVRPGDRAPAMGRAPNHRSALPLSSAAHVSEPGNRVPTIESGTPNESL